MSESDLKKAFTIEADKYFPFPKETVYIDCHIADPKGTDRKMSVFIAAVKKEMVDGRLKILKDAGIEPVVVTLGGIAVANAFSAFPPAVLSQSGAKGAVAIVDIGETSTNLMIFTEGSLRFSRDIFIGIADFVKRVANIVGCPPADARAALYSSAPRQEAMQRALETAVTGLVSELRLSFDYFTTEKNTPITQLFPIGDGAAVPGIETAFAMSFDMPSFVWNPFEKLSLGPGIKREDVDKDGRRFITALGLALNEYDTA
jgi:type IV pilus assembly protein PilM